MICFKNYLVFTVTTKNACFSQNDMHCYYIVIRASLQRLIYYLNDLKWGIIISTRKVGHSISEVDIKFEFSPMTTARVSTRTVMKLPTYDISVIIKRR